MEAGKDRSKVCAGLHKEFLDDYFLPAMAHYTRSMYPWLSQEIPSSLRLAREKARGPTGQMNSQMALSIDSFIVEQVLANVHAKLRSQPASLLAGFQYVIVGHGFKNVVAVNDHELHSGITLVRAYQKVKAPFYKRASPGDVMLKDFRPKAILKEAESLEKKVVCIPIMMLDAAS